MTFANGVVVYEFDNSGLAYGGISFDGDQLTLPTQVQNTFRARLDPADSSSTQRKLPWTVYGNWAYYQNNGFGVAGDELSRNVRLFDMGSSNPSTATGLPFAEGTIKKFCAPNDKNQSWYALHKVTSDPANVRLELREYGFPVSGPSAQTSTVLTTVRQSDVTFNPFTAYDAATVDRHWIFATDNWVYLWLFEDSGAGHVYAVPETVNLGWTGVELTGASAAMLAGDTVRANKFTAARDKYFYASGDQVFAGSGRESASLIINRPFGGNVTSLALYATPWHLWVVNTGSTGLRNRIYRYYHDGGGRVEYTLGAGVEIDDIRVFYPANLDYTNRPFWVSPAADNRHVLLNPDTPLLLDWDQGNNVSQSFAIQRKRGSNIVFWSDETNDWAGSGSGLDGHDWIAAVGGDSSTFTLPANWAPDGQDFEFRVQFLPTDGTVGSDWSEPVRVTTTGSPGTFTPTAPTFVSPTATDRPDGYEQTTFEMRVPTGWTASHALLRRWNNDISDYEYWNGTRWSEGSSTINLNGERTGLVLVHVQPYGSGNVELPWQNPNTVFPYSVAYLAVIDGVDSPVRSQWSAETNVTTDTADPPASTPPFIDRILLPELPLQIVITDNWNAGGLSGIRMERRRLLNDGAVDTSFAVQYLQSLTAPFWSGTATSGVSGVYADGQLTVELAAGFQGTRELWEYRMSVRTVLAGWTRWSDWGKVWGANPAPFRLGVVQLEVPQWGQQLPLGYRAPVYAVLPDLPPAIANTSVTFWRETLEDDQVTIVPGSRVDLESSGDLRGRYIYNDNFVVAGTANTWYRFTVRFDQLLTGYNEIDAVYSEASAHVQAIPAGPPPVFWAGDLETFGVRRIDPTQQRRIDWWHPDPFSWISIVRWNTAGESRVYEYGSLNGTVFTWTTTVSQIQQTSSHFVLPANFQPANTRYRYQLRALVTHNGVQTWTALSQWREFDSNPVSLPRPTWALPVGSTEPTSPVDLVFNSGGLDFTKVRLRLHWNRVGQPDVDYYARQGFGLFLVGLAEVAHVYNVINIPGGWLTGYGPNDSVEFYVQYFHDGSWSPESAMLGPISLTDAPPAQPYWVAPAPNVDSTAYVSGTYLSLDWAVPYNQPYSRVEIRRYLDDGTPDSFQYLRMLNGIPVFTNLESYLDSFSQSRITTGADWQDDDSTWVYEVRVWDGQWSQRSEPLKISTSDPPEPLPPRPTITDPPRNSHVIYNDALTFAWSTNGGAQAEVQIYREIAGEGEFLTLVGSTHVEWTAGTPHNPPAAATLAVTETIMTWPPGNPGEATYGWQPDDAIGLYLLRYRAAGATLWSGWSHRRGDAASNGEFHRIFTTEGETFGSGLGDPVYRDTGFLSSARFSNIRNSLSMRVGLRATLLSPDMLPVRDISYALIPEMCSISYDASRNVRTTAELTFNTDEDRHDFPLDLWMPRPKLDWFGHRVLLTMVLTDEETGHVGYKNVGVYVIDQLRTSRDLGDSYFTAQAYDLFALLDTAVGYSFSVDEFTVISDSIREALASFGQWLPTEDEPSSMPPAPSTVDFSVAHADVRWLNSRVWRISEGMTWLRMIRQMCEEGGFRAPWMDRDGVLVVDRGGGLDTTIELPAGKFNVVGTEVSEEIDYWGQPTEWIFVANDPHPKAPLPDGSVGFLRFTHTEVDEFLRRGRRRVKRLVQSGANYGPDDEESSAETFAVEFQEQALREFDQDQAAKSRVRFTMIPNPDLWHADVVKLPHDGRKWLVQRWDLPFDGQDMRVEAVEV